MSDEPKGPWCGIWDGLFWTFIGDDTPFFLRNPRLSMMARSWEKMSPEKQAAHRSAADGFLARLGVKSSASGRGGQIFVFRSCR